MRNVPSLSALVGSTGTLPAPPGVFLQSFYRDATVPVKYRTNELVYKCRNKQSVAVEGDVTCVANGVRRLGLVGPITLVG